MISAEDTANFLDASLPAAASTPFVLSLCELTCHAAMATELASGETTVGSNVTLKHLAPTPVGHILRAAATLKQREGRKLFFEVTVTDRGMGNPSESAYWTNESPSFILRLAISRFLAREKDGIPRRRATPAAKNANRRVLCGAIVHHGADRIESPKVNDDRA